MVNLFQILLFETITESLRQLTCQKADIVWNGKQESDFIEIKTFISKAPVLSYFHQAFETKIVAGASKQGLGSVQATLKIVLLNQKLLADVHYRPQRRNIPNLNEKH